MQQSEQAVRRDMLVALALGIGGVLIATGDYILAGEDKSKVSATALAEAEVEYHDHTSHQVWVAFPVASQRDFAPLDGCMRTDLLGASVVIWTTTPWTIPQNRAVAFGPGIAYGLYQVTGDKAGTYLLADQLAPGVFAAAKLEALAQGAEIASSRLF